MFKPYVVHRRAPACSAPALAAEYGEFGSNTVVLGPRPVVDRPVDLVGTDVNHPRDADAQAGVEQRLRTEHVGDDELRCTDDRAVDMCLGSEVDDDVVAGQHVEQQLLVDDVTVDEPIVRIAADRCEIVEIAGVRELVEHRHGRVRRSRDTDRRAASVRSASR